MWLTVPVCLYLEDLKHCTHQNYTFCPQKWLLSREYQKPLENLCSFCILSKYIYANFPSEETYQRGAAIDM